jgi:hypothetical protein
MDKLTAQQRHKNMAAIRGKDTEAGAGADCAAWLVE